MVDIGLCEWVEEETVWDLLKEVFTDKSALGSIIGGLVGGVFTYLAVIWTFSKEKRNTYPARLVKLTEMIFIVEDYKSVLIPHMHRLEKDVYMAMPEALNLEDFNRRIITMAASVDKQTYRSLFDARENQLTPDALSVFNSNTSAGPPTALKAGEPIPNYIESVLTILKDRVSYYEKRI